MPETATTNTITTNTITTKQAAALLGVSVNTFRCCQSRHQIHATPETRGLKLGRGHESLYVYEDVLRLKADLDARNQERAANQRVTYGKKRCGKCGQRLPIAQFHACTVTRSGLSTWCKGCTANANRAYFQTTVVGEKRIARAARKREQRLILQAVMDGKGRHPRGFFLVKVEATGLFFARATNDPNRRTGKIIAQMQPVDGLVEGLPEEVDSTDVQPCQPCQPWSVFCAEQWGVVAAHVAAWLLSREQRVYSRRCHAGVTRGGQAHG